jgi:uncharacterized C2H2 Zn-finger protein
LSSREACVCAAEVDITSVSQPSLGFWGTPVHASTCISTADPRKTEHCSSSASDSTRLDLSPNFPLSAPRPSESKKLQCDRCGLEFESLGSYKRHPKNGFKCKERRTGVKTKQTRRRLTAQESRTVANNFVKLVADGIRQANAAQQLGYRLSQCTTWMAYHGVCWDINENRKLGPAWKILGRTVRKSAKKYKNLMDGAGRPLSEPLRTYGALLLACNNEVRAWPEKYTYRLVQDQSEYTSRGSVWCDVG